MTHRLIAPIIVILLVGVGLGGCGHHSPTSPTRAQIVYVAMGASDAVGIGAFPLNKGYVYKIQEGLLAKARQVPLYNLGVIGKRINYFEEVELPLAITCQPDVVTIWAGPNDIIRGTSVAAFQSSLRRILSQLRAQTSAVIVLANLPDMTKIPRFLIDPDDDVTMARIIAFNAAIAQESAAHNVPLVDVFAGGYAVDWWNVTLDGFHLSNKGHAKMAELFLDILLRYF